MKGDLISFPGRCISAKTGKMRGQGRRSWKNKPHEQRPWGRKDTGHRRKSREASRAAAAGKGENTGDRLREAELR